MKHNFKKPGIDRMTDAMTDVHYMHMIIQISLKTSGFCIHHSIFFTFQRIPIWWRWYYWANPVAWSLYGLLTSQYGDVNDSVILPGGINSVPIKDFLREQFGFRHEFLGVAIVAVGGFCLLFAVTFGFAIKYFNFQRR